MREFAAECVEVLLEMSDNKMPLDNYLGAYRQHFGRDFKAVNLSVAYKCKGLKSQLFLMLKRIPDTIIIGVSTSMGGYGYFIQLTEMARESNIPHELNVIPTGFTDVEDEDDIKDVGDESEATSTGQQQNIDNKGDEDSTPKSAKRGDKRREEIRTEEGHTGIDDFFHRFLRASRRLFGCMAWGSKKKL